MAIIEIKVPSPGESVNEVDLYNWLVEDGSYVKKDTEIVELDSAKATLTVVAEESGVISFQAEEGDTLDVGAVLCTIDTSAVPADVPVEEKAPEAPAPKAKEPEAAPVQVAQTPTPAPAAQPAAKAASDMSVDNLIQQMQKLSRSDKATLASALGLTAALVEENRNSNTERMSALRRKLSERLVSVKNETAMLTTFNEVDMKPIMDLRKKHQKRFVETYGFKLGLMSFFLKASAVALKEFPTVNAMLEGENMTSFEYVDISVAVSTPKGLMVPVIRNVETLSLAEIEQTIADVAEKARTGKLTIPEMTGGTFTVTNGGVFGSMMSTPIINPPQSAILGMHNITDRAVVIEGEITIRPMMYLALSYDHRIIDGRESVSFLVRVKQLLENPTEMLFGALGGERTLLGI